MLYHLTIPIIFLTGIEPISPHSQYSVLPIKLQELVRATGFAPITMILKITILLLNYALNPDSRIRTHIDDFGKHCSTVELYPMITRTGLEPVTAYLSGKCSTN